MLKTLLAQVKEYNTASILTPVFSILEVFMEGLIPMIMGKIIDNGINGNDVGYAVKMGLVMLLMAGLSLAFGVLGGRFGAKASACFAANLRTAMYANIQTFSFSNIDKYSTTI